MQRLARLGLCAALAAAAWGGSACGGAASQTRPATSPAFDLEEATIADLQARMARGEETARSLAGKYLARIAQIDRQGPSLRSLIEINPDALSIADALDAERKARGPRGPLHGVPIVVKDNIATADRMTTTAGSLALEGVRAPHDAFVAARLREAGAVLLGKTNLSEWANFRSSTSSSGWSARGGQTKNPYALDRTPCGSSSGSAAAVAANLAAAAVGTETSGSIVCPSHAASIVGLKPTLGLVSRTGIVPIAASLDTAGPMGRTVADVAALLDVLDGVDPQDASTAAAGAYASRDYAAALDADGLRGARIGVVRERLFGYSPAADRLAERALADMRAHGAEIVDPADIPGLAAIGPRLFELLLREFKRDLNAYLAWLGPVSPVRTLEDVIAFNAAHRDVELKYFDQWILETAQARTPLGDAAHRRTVEELRRAAGELGIGAVLDRFRLDALVAPTAGPPWLIDLVNGDALGEGSPSPIAAAAGYPHLTVPMGYYRGLPLGLSFIGRAWSEPTLLKLAYAYEQATKHRRPPAFAATADLESPPASAR